MQRTASSSIRVPAATRRRVSALAKRMHASSHGEVIDRALDRLEHELFWVGFDEDAKAYLEAFPGEARERDAFSGTMADGLKR